MPFFLSLSLCLLSYSFYLFFLRGGGGSCVLSIVIFVEIIIMFYFFLNIRPLAVGACWKTG